jgi:hypothetical protein
MSSVEEHLVIHKNHQGRTDGRSSRGYFMNLCEPLDLVEVQGRYGGVFSMGSKLRRGKTIDEI